MERDSQPPSPYAADGLIATRRRLGDGEALFFGGDPVREMYYIERGMLRLQRHLDDGRLVPISRARAGETVAEASLFARHYHCDCIADGLTVVAAYPRARVLAALESDPARAAALLRHVAAQVHGLRSRVEILTLPGAAPRVLAYLGLHGDPATGVWQMDRTWKAVAEELGLTHEALYRALARLERAGRIRRDGRSVAFAD